MKWPWQPAVRVSAKIAAKLLNGLTGLLSEDVRALKKALEILNTKNTSRRILISTNSHDSAVSLTIFLSSLTRLSISRFGIILK